MKKITLYLNRDLLKGYLERYISTDFGNDLYLIENRDRLRHWQHLKWRLLWKYLMASNC